MTDSYGSCPGRLPLFFFSGLRREDGGKNHRHLRCKVGSGCDGILGPGAVYFVQQRKGRGVMIVYLDGVIGLNFLVDLLLLLGVNRLSGLPAGVGRAAAAAALGGGYAGACLIPGLRFLSTALWRTVSLGLVTVLAFGVGRSAFRRGVLFVLLSMAMGGLVISFDTGDCLGLVFCALVLSGLCAAGFQGKAIPRRIAKVALTQRGRQYDFLALVDTGNTLRDPASGEQVLILGPELARVIANLDEGALLDPVRTVCEGTGFRLIPYQTVGNGGLMVGMRCERIVINGKEAGNLVAFSPQSFPGGEYQALTGGSYG